MQKHDAEFIAHAREDIPALLAEIDRLRAAAREALDLLTSVELQQVSVKGKAATIRKLREAVGDG